MTTGIVIRTANIPAGRRTPAEVKTALDPVLDGADLFLGQELEEAAAVLAAWPGFDSHIVRADRRWAELPVLWNPKALTLVEPIRVRVGTSRWGRIVGGRFATVAGGAEFVALNVHPPARPESTDHRRQVYLATVDALVGLARRYFRDAGLPFLVGGDWNHLAHGKPHFTKPLLDLGLVVESPGPTHAWGKPKQTAIDYFIAGGFEAVSGAAVMRRRFSDHSPVTVTFHLPAPKPAPKPTPPKEEPAVDRFISTRQWGANEAKNATPAAYPIDSPTRGVTLHWTGNGYGWPWAHSRCDDLVRGIERSHEYGNGWGDIAYNLLVCPHGYVFEGRGANVRSSANGDTVPNRQWYAVCYLGGKGDAFTADGKAGMVWAVQYLRRVGNAGPRVNGHRNHKQTECPGDAIYRWLRATNFDTTATTQEDDMPTPDELWNHPIPYDANGPQPAKKVLRWAARSAGRSDTRTAEILRVVKDLAAVAGDATLSDADRKALVDGIAERIEAIEAADLAPEVADLLEVAPKETP